RIELIPYATFGAWGLDPFPMHRESITVDAWLNDEGFRKEYPFICINGSRSYEFFHSENRQQATMREFHPNPLVRISTQTAEEYSMHDGDWIWMENTQGRCMQQVKVDATLNPNYVHAEHGWWFPEQEAAEPNLFGTFNCNVNNLTHSFETGHGGIGGPFKNICCKIYKVEEGDTIPGEQITELGGFKTFTPCEPF
ncbi:MAG: dehydrogenase, partial [Actinobacteria bacterium]|nr:dehydrogenase [Actinomycetota bacterium]